MNAQDLEFSELLDYVYDYHYDLWWCTPRFDKEPSREDLLKMVEGLDRELNDRSSTPEGRAALRREGWDIEFQPGDELYDNEVPDYDYDGQPDEAQEWHDFDPDC